jgi:hypothetical protein
MFHSVFASRVIFCENLGFRETFRENFRYFRENTKMKIFVSTLRQTNVEVEYELNFVNVILKELILIVWNIFFLSSFSYLKFTIKTGGIGPNVVG